MLEYVRLAVVAQGAAGKGVEYLPIVKFRDVRLPSWARAHDKFVMIEVCGSSLKDARICNGDYVLVYLTKDTREGDLVAINTPEGLLIKYAHLETDGRVRLESANKKYPPKWFDSNEIDITGKVIRVEIDL